MVLGHRERYSTIWAARGTWRLNVVRIHSPDPDDPTGTDPATPVISTDVMAELLSTTCLTLIPSTNAERSARFWLIRHMILRVLA